jgi:hypothetical protein
MKPQLPLLVMVLGAAVFRSFGQSEVSLAPWFGDGMILQRDVKTQIEGTAQPKTDLIVEMWSGNNNVWWGPKKNFVSSNEQGHWKLPIDLTKAEYLGSDKRWSLRVEERKNKKLGQEAHDIIIGDVIVVAGWENQGISAGRDEFVAAEKLFADNQDAIRFLDLTRVNSDDAPRNLPGAKWENWPKDRSDLNRYSALTLRLAHLLAESEIPKLATSRHIGIVLTRRQMVANALDPGRFKAPNGFDSLDQKIWQWATMDARIAQTNRSRTLVQNKRHNIVMDIPPVTLYDSAQWCSGQDFDPDKPPLEWFSVAGAIWSAPRQQE